jgi:hypothetical protein
MGAKIFPSRATVCTAGVTILDNGPTPSAEIIYRNKKPQRIDLPLEDPSAKLTEIVSRKNTEVKDVQMVRVWYPNKFTGNGIVLVDTPGVNDPENWREEITYSYLAQADAVIMLLDPMQPLSKSEIHIQYFKQNFLNSNPHPTMLPAAYRGRTSTRSNLE